MLSLAICQQACGLANGADPDQNAPQEQSDLGVHYLHCPNIFITVLPDNANEEELTQFRFILLIL